MIHIRLKRIAEQLLFASNIFIAFLLLFENKLVIPPWPQTLGRMHPLMLHFPIVILLLAMIMEFFRFRTENSTNTFYRNYSRNLLLVGSLFAAVTVIMGLFLSREEGYSGETLIWHKWTGAALFFLASFIYLIRNKKWYKAPVAKSGALITVVAIVLTGHYGAAITHGENFIFEPVSREKVMAFVPVDKAEVFKDVIKPILEQKCVSCHNPDKMKGELVLTDPKSILKGGKTGKLFVAGNPEISLLLERIHLSLDDKKHMPPVGKTQLTPEEIALLTLWVKENGGFNKKVLALPVRDSLRLLATAKLKPVEKQEDIYDFSAADAETVKKLNNDYRTVSELARESPALSVNIYNKSAFNARQLDELDEVKKQIVSLNLNKMPVRDSDLKSISKFENLRKLGLNFTEVTAKGLKELTSLKYLETLTLSGTKINFEDFQAVLPGFKNLKTISVWDTGLSSVELERLKITIKKVAIIGGFKDDGTEPLKLNLPQIKNSSTIFAQTIPLQLKHPVKGVEIRFTTNGTEPDSLKSPIFNGKTVLSQNTTIKAKAFKTGWLSSDVVTFDFFKSAYKPDSVNILFPLDRVHQAEGDKTFFNSKLGVIGANNPAWANNWAAVKENDMALLCEFKKPVPVSSVGLHYMIEEDTGIFPPELVEVWGGANPKQMKLLIRFSAALPSKGDKPSLKSIEGKFRTETVTYLKIVAKPLNKMPKWHRDRDKKALLLIDEMFLN